MDTFRKHLQINGKYNFLAIICLITQETTPDPSKLRSYYRIIRNVCILCVSSIHFRYQSLANEVKNRY